MNAINIGDIWDFNKCIPIYRFPEFQLFEISRPLQVELEALCYEA